jgi:hypothetical protein
MTELYFGPTWHHPGPFISFLSAVESFFLLLGTKLAVAVSILEFLLCNIPATTPKKLLVYKTPKKHERLISEHNMFASCTNLRLLFSDIPKGLTCHIIHVICVIPRIIHFVVRITATLLSTSMPLLVLARIV